MINYQLSILIGVFAFVYTYILTRPNNIFNGAYNRLYKLFKTDERQQKGKSAHWLFMIIMYCEKCFAGQFALWLFLYIHWDWYCDRYSSFEFWIDVTTKHIFFVTFTILSAAVIKNVYTKYIEHD